MRSSLPMVIAVMRGPKYLCNFDQLQQHAHASSRILTRKGGGTFLTNCKFCGRGNLRLFVILIHPMRTQRRTLTRSNPRPRSESTVAFPGLLQSLSSRPLEVLNLGSHATSPMGRLHDYLGPQAHSLAHSPMSALPINLF